MADDERQHPTAAAEADREFRREELRQAGEIRREEIRADVRKVVYGTLVLGVAVAFFPVVSGFIEHTYNARIEKLRQVNALQLQSNQLALDLKRLEREHELAVATAAAATEQSDRSFFESIADEARSAKLSDRITIAEFFTFVSRDKDERERWAAFLDYIGKLQQRLNERRAELLLITGNAARPLLEREAAARELRQIDQRERGVIAAAESSQWLAMVPIPLEASLGAGVLAPPSVPQLRSLLGEPSVAPAGNVCRSADGPILSKLVETRDVGPFRATLIRPALDSLERALAALREREPDLYGMIGTAGGLCVRLVRGSSSALSNHSWGTAIDFTIGGSSTPFASREVQAGLIEIARELAEEGWIWGAYFRVPDGMHFAVSDEQLRRWHTEGLLTPQDTAAAPPPGAGDPGEPVVSDGAIDPEAESE